MKPHIFVDESKVGGYTLVAACVVPSDLADTRRLMRGLLLPGQRRLHFSDERDSRRRQILDTIHASGVRSRIYACRSKAELTARQACLAKVAADAAEMSAELIVIERDDSTMSHDRRTLFQHLRGSELRYEHKRPYEDSLLWIPDAVAWSWTKGGVWRKRIEDAVEAVEQLHL